MAVFEYTVKYNGRKYLPGEEVPINETPKTEKVAVAEEVAVTPSVKEEVKPSESKKGKSGRKPKD